MINHWKAIAALGVLTIGGLGVGGNAFASTSPQAAKTVASTAAPTVAGSCLKVHDDSWPGWTQGRPDRFDAGDTGGVYMWHDNDGWHLRVSHATDDKSVFSGRIATSGHLVGVRGVALERNDNFKVGPNGHLVTFRFQNYGHVDGLDFHTTCAPSITFSYSRAGHTLPSERVFVGDHKANPATDPFRITRTE